MKKLLSLLLILGIVLLCGCSGDRSAEQAGASVSVREGTSGEDVILGKSSAEAVMAMIDAHDWEDGVIVQDDRYHFVIDGTLEFDYSMDMGYFNNKESGKHIELSKKEKKQLDSIIDNAFGNDGWLKSCGPKKE